MESSILFPNLGIHLKNVGQFIDVFGFEIAYYGMIIGTGVIAGILLAAYLAKKTGQNPDTYYDLAIYEVIFSIIGARLYYVIFSWDVYKDDLLSIFNLREGGLAIYGAVIAAVITAIVYAKVKKISFWVLADTGAPALILGQILGRWGNFFNREAFGEYTNSLFAMQLPVEAVRNADITEKMWKNIVEIEGVQFIQAHPTFLYESLWNVCVLAFMLWWMKRKKFEGEIFLIYLLGYGVGRSWIEGLRTDPLLIPGTSVPVSQVLALVLVITSAVLMYVKRKKSKVAVTSEESDVASEESDVTSEESSVEGE